MLLTAVLLGLAICAAWLPPLSTRWGKLPPWVALLVTTLLSASIQGLVDWRGLMAVIVAWGLAAGSTSARAPSIRRVLKVMAVGLCFALAIQQIPGFAPFVFLRDVVISANAGPMRLSARLDSGIAGLLLLAFYCRRVESRSEVRRIVGPALAISVATTLIVISFAVAIGYLAVDVKLPWFTAWHLAKTLLWTCVVEEAFFRGVIQQGLSDTSFVRTHPSLKWLPVAVASVLFGLAHAPGGATIAVLATLAGVGYGIAYAKTGRIEAALFAHFFLNGVHFVALTYPFLLKGA